jgi:hypothetical protein
MAESAITLQTSYGLPLSTRDAEIGGGDYREGAHMSYYR